MDFRITGDHDRLITCAELLDTPSWLAGRSSRTATGLVQTAAEWNTWALINHPYGTY